MKKTVLIIASLLLVVGSALAQDLKIQNFRAPDQRGINVFEPPKEVDAEYDGVKIWVGGHFTQQYQALNHSNKADFMPVSSEDQRDLNALYDLSPGFNLATANLNMDVQLADGIRLSMVTYLSARHHPEAWVKGGYIQMDKIPLNSEVLDKIMEYVTIKIGHMEINYGDQHFRRTDNANSIYNPFVGNYIMDAFNTEIGGEVYFRTHGFMAMIAASNGLINGSVTNGEGRSPAIYGKLGYDKQISDDLRIRLTGSVYHVSKSSPNHLFDGDRGGSRYYYALQPAFVSSGGTVRSASASSDFRTGRYVPGLSSKVTAFVVNPFIKVKGLEVFGTYEMAKGGKASEVAADAERTVSQLGIEGIYRFFKNENVYVGVRYNNVSAEEVIGGETMDVSVDRIQAGAGWFITRNVLMKLEYMKQNYKDFPSSDYRHMGEIHGVMVEAAVGF